MSILSPILITLLVCVIYAWAYPATTNAPEAAKRWPIGASGSKKVSSSDSVQAAMVAAKAAIPSPSLGLAITVKKSNNATHITGTSEKA